MYTKNLNVWIASFFIFISTQSIQSKHQFDNQSNQLATHLNQNDTSPNNSQQYQELWKEIEESYHKTVEQTQTIEFSLQTIEQIINAEKIKINSRSISKSQLLNQIAQIKEIIQMNATFIKDLAKDQAICAGTCCNAVYLEYLLPIIQGNDITLINAEIFQDQFQTRFESLVTTIQDEQQLAEMYEYNQYQLDALVQASDNIGLSACNKLYRYLDTKQVPWYGKSILATTQDALFWSAMGLSAYAISLYAFTTNDTKIPFTKKVFQVNDEQPVKKILVAHDSPENKQFIAQVKADLEESTVVINGQPFMNTDAKTPESFKQLESLATRLSDQSAKVTKPVNVHTWTEKDATGRDITYRHGTAAEYLPLKQFIGSGKVVNTYNRMLDENQQAEVYKTFTIFNKIHDAVYSFQDLFIAGIFAFLGRQTMPTIKENFKDSQKKWDRAFNYYIKGDTAQRKGATDFSKAYFKDFVGGDHLEKLAYELADYLKNPTRYERQDIGPSTGYLLVGPPQTGKSFFAKALKTLIDEQFENDIDKVKFHVVTPDDVKFFGGFANIFNAARKSAPIILFIDEIDMYGTRREKDGTVTQELLTSMNGIETDPSKKVIVIAATNRPEELEAALKHKGRLGTTINFDNPTYECRKEYLERQLVKKNIVINNDMIDTIAQETDGHTFNMLDAIIKHALQLATFQTRLVQENDFEITMDREIRKIKPNTSMSTQEKELVACYQAGQAVAHHVLKIDQQIVKITIDTVDKQIKTKEGIGIVNEAKGQSHENYELLPAMRIKATRPGFVFTISRTNNHDLISDEDQEKELLALMSGHAALELMYNKSFNQFGKEDRAKIIDILEKQIAQGTPITHEIRLQALKAKDVLFEKAKQNLKNHLEFVTFVANELVKNHNINKTQWAELTANYKL